MGLALKRNRLDCVLVQILAGSSNLSFGHPHPPRPSGHPPHQNPGAGPQRTEGFPTLPFPRVICRSENQHQFFVWKKTSGEEKTEGKASVAREVLLGSTSSRSPFDSVSLTWMNRCRWRGFLHPLYALLQRVQSCCLSGLLGLCSTIANLFQKHFSIPQENNFQRGTGHWGRSGPVIPVLI